MIAPQLCLCILLCGRKANIECGNCDNNDDNTDDNDSDIHDDSRDVNVVEKIIIVGGRNVNDDIESVVADDAGDKNG